MRPSITQESDYGCGVACFAFACGLTYQQAVRLIGKEYSVKHGWRPSDLVQALNERGLSYKNRYVRKQPLQLYDEATIVLLERSADYPVGHYLVRHRSFWMDPWVNMVQDNRIAYARSGFRTRLPGWAMYALTPET